MSGRAGREFLRRETDRNQRPLHKRRNDQKGPDEGIGNPQQRGQTDALEDRVLGEGQNAEAGERGCPRHQNRLADQRHKRMRFVEIPTVGAHVVDSVVDPHSHDDDPEHDSRDVDRPVQKLQRPERADQREDNGGEDDQRQPPVQKEQKNDQDDPHTDDEGDLGENRNEDIPQSPVEEPRIEEARQALPPEAAKEILRLVGRPGRQHRNLNP